MIKMHGITGFACMASLLVFSTSSSASLIQNGSFEINTVGSYATLGGGDSTSITGWTTVHSGVEIFTTPSAADGSYVIDLNNYIYSQGGISQVFATEAGKRYTVSFSAATIQQSGRDGTGQVDVKIGNDTFSYFLENHSSAYNWQVYSFDYIATDITTTLTFSNSSNSFQHFSFIDGVDSNLATLPLPATAWLLVSGLLGLLGIRRKV